jgi:GGDEF domain-containing protein
MVSETVRRSLSAKSPFETEYRIIHRDLSVRWVYGKGRIFCDERGDAHWLDGAILDITDRKEAELALAATNRELLEVKKELQRQAFYDDLTGLANRRLFLDRLRHALDVARRDKKKVGLLYIDLNRLKDVNDTYGHHIGDAVLRIVAKRLVNAVRKTDTTARLGGDESGVSARLGGDEFGVLFKGNINASNIQAIIRRISKSIKRPIAIEEKSCRVSASIGFAIFPDDGDDGDMLIRHADDMMYRVKRREADPFP